MPHPALPVTLLALVAAPLGAAGDQRRGGTVQVTQLTIHERIVIRVPRMPDPTPAKAPKPIRWKEKKGPNCVTPASMAGAIISAPKQVDLVFIGGKRVRAKLDRDCRPLDFYSGFYLRPASDGMICAGRDPIRVRSGASCGIDQFRLLQASN